MHQEELLPTWLTNANFSASELMQNEESEFSRVAERVQYNLALLCARFFMDLQGEQQNDDVKQLQSIFSESGKKLLQMVKQIYASRKAWSLVKRKYKNLAYLERRQLKHGENAGYVATQQFFPSKREDAPDAITITLFGGEVLSGVMGDFHTSVSAHLGGKDASSQVEKILSQHRNLIVRMEKEGKTELEFHLKLEPPTVRTHVLTIEKIEVRVKGILQTVHTEMQYPEGNDFEVVHDRLLQLYENLQGQIRQKLEKEATTPHASNPLPRQKRS